MANVGHFYKIFPAYGIKSFFKINAPRVDQMNLTCNSAVASLMLSRFFLDCFDINLPLINSTRTNFHERPTVSYLIIKTEMTDQITGRIYNRSDDRFMHHYMHQHF